MVSRLVRDNLTTRARRFNLVMDDVSITHVAFSPEFTHAVEAKQIAQQTALRAAFLVDQAIQEKQSIIVRAQGEARSAELIGEAVKKNKGFLKLRKLEAARDIATTLAQSGNKIMLDAQSLLLNVWVWGDSLCYRTPLLTPRLTALTYCPLFSLSFLYVPFQTVRTKTQTLFRIANRSKQVSNEIEEDVFSKECDSSLLSFHP